MSNATAGISPDPIRFEEAIKAIKRRVPMTEDVWGQLEKDELEFAFTVADVAQLDMVVDVYEAIQRAVEEGTTLEHFKAEVGDGLEAAWGEADGARVESIFRTNVQGAYNAGRHEAAQAVKADRPYWRYQAILDNRTSDVCSECDGTVLSADDEWFQTHYPPLHPNALAEGTMILTTAGEKPIETVRPGEMVLTHKRRWRPVVAVLGRRPDEPHVRELHLSTGRTLSVSDEHPVLTTGISGWKLGRDLKVGDVLFHHGKPVAGPCEVATGDPDDCPPLPSQGVVPYEIVRLAERARMVLAVDLETQKIGRECKVQDVWPNHELGLEPNASGGDEASRNPLRMGGRDARLSSEGVGHLLPGSRVAAGISIPHALGVTREEGAGLLAHAEEGMGGSVTMRSRVCDRGLFGPRSDLDPVAFAPKAQDGFSDPKRTLNAADRFAAIPVAFLNQVRDDLPVSEVGWFHATIIDIVEVGPQKRLWNLVVWEDETYVASGVLVHNCRCIAVTLTEAQAEAEGISGSGPAVEPVEGFGQVPSGGGGDWTPDPADYPDEFGAELEDKMAEEDAG